MFSTIRTRDGVRYEAILLHSFEITICVLTCCAKVFTLLMHPLDRTGLGSYHNSGSCWSLLMCNYA